MEFWKGHGTGNDFVVLPDAPDLSAEQVRALCDRRFGLGADGVLRVVRRPDGFFMDYRNADGSIAEMCGNGVRVFVRYLVTVGLVDPEAPVEVLTRAGRRPARVLPDGTIAVGMGAARFPGPEGVLVDGVPATPVDVGNPHAVVLVDDLDALPRPLPEPEVTPGAFPAGVNVEYVVRCGARHVAMRVHERGVGETLSCGTGVCAAAAAVARLAGDWHGTWTVDVPGGRLRVSLQDGGEVELAGPAELVARGEWLAELG